MNANFKLTPEALKSIIDRCNEMLKNDKVKKHYDSFGDECEAEDWLVNAAIYTLSIPKENRKK